MNSMIETILAHRSVRKFTPEKLSEKTIETLVEAAQMASTSSYIQAYSIIGIKEQSKKNKLAELAGNQPYVAENGHLFIFCADFHRHNIAGKQEGTEVIPAIESTEKMIVGITDASLAAQNCALAAESLGYGICYIGGLRNNIKTVSELLELPDHVIPLFGLCVGVPAAQTETKPRLPLEGVYFEDKYPDDSQHIAQLEKYNSIVSEYYNKRTAGNRNQRWTEQITGMLSSVKRAHMKQFLQEKGYGRH
ncbi:oxygen-insensitive NADPH nitroreductase [Alkalicoccus daliensis]|uniref:FMN reductase (NADPH) n=1 Tax=Alkalicoccus daliensis TaxID=745820 RepID=A0A1G9ZP40_9BACI|nr:oxygen-insensitive NADPH nitroreductase [Alkalicoccus daliensis]SDN22970.1 FMN reductase (NADPH) [Alkalicoccus daliensis]